MNDSNLYELLKEDCVVYDSVIDIGCKFFQDLINFEESPFKQLIGLDLVFPAGAFRNYQLGKQHINQSPSIQYFKNRYITLEKDVQKYSFIGKSYSLIICRHLLHFFSDREKLKLIDSFYNSLQLEGIMFLKLNHSGNKDITACEKVKQIGPKTYQSIDDDSVIYYLVDSDQFINTITTIYPVVSKYTYVTEKAVTIVIKKSVIIDKPSFHT